MKITKRQLLRIIQEEDARWHGDMQECGEDMMMDDTMVIEPGPAALETGPGPVLESESPEESVLVEMVVAARALEQVVESVQNAAQLCPNCVPSVAAQAPLMEAMVHQAEALQETLEAQAEVLQENANVGAVEIDITGDVADIPAEDAFGLGYEAGKQNLT